MKNGLYSGIYPAIKLYFKVESVIQKISVHYLCCLPPIMEIIISRLFKKINRFSFFN